MTMQTRKRAIVHSVPDALYSFCMRSVTRHLKEFDVHLLTMLPVLIKSQILRNVTRRGDGFGFCDSPPYIRALLHRELVQLDLTSCPSISGAQLCSIVAVVPKLRELRIAQSDTNQALQPHDLIDVVSRLPELRALYMSRVDAVTDEVLHEIGNMCPSLEVLDVSHCVNISDECAGTVREMCLKKMNVSHTRITDNFLYQLRDSSFNKHAEEINLSECAVTCTGLKNLSWDKLQYIGFKGANLTDMDFVKKLGNLKFIQWTIST